MKQFNNHYFMYLIIGLGNPGKQYENTRHNIGFMVLNKLTEERNLSFKKEKKFNSETCRLTAEVLLAKPLTFMNNSGLAVNSLITYYSITQLLIIHDDVDLELGRLKIQKSGGTAGHHGLESIVKSLRTSDFIRFRVGIGRPAENIKYQISNIKYQKETMNYVLENFSKGEWQILKRIIEKTVEAIEYYLEFGLEKAMNKYNQSN